MTPIAVALYTTESSITEIDTKSKYDDRTKTIALLPFRSFDLSTSNPQYLTSVIPLLTRLHLDFDIRYLHNDLRDLTSKICFDRDHVASILSKASSLQYLFLSVIDHAILTYKDTPHTSFRATLKDCRLPRLKSLILVGLDATEDQMTQFLEGSPNLEYLYLLGMRLKIGTWATFASTIRRVVPLRDIMLHWLLERSNTEQDTLPYAFDQHKFDEYFNGNGENPLTQQANERWTFGQSEMDRRYLPLAKFEAHYRWAHQEGKHLSGG